MRTGKHAIERGDAGEQTLQVEGEIAGQGIGLLARQAQGTCCTCRRIGGDLEGEDAEAVGGVGHRADFIGHRRRPMQGG